jgi:hypothetical protein
VTAAMVAAAQAGSKSPLGPGIAIQRSRYSVDGVLSDASEMEAFAAGVEPSDELSTQVHT